MEVARFSHRVIDKCSVMSFLDSVRIAPSAVESFLVKVFRGHEEKRGQHISRSFLGEGLIPNIELWLENFEVHLNHTNGVRVERQCGVMSRSVSRRLVRVRSGSKRTLTARRLRSPDCMFKI